MFRLQTRIWSLTVIAALILNATKAEISAQEPRIQVAIDAEEIFVGESFTMQVVVEGIESSESPDVGLLDEEFKVQFETEQSMNANSVVIINGRMSRKEELKTLYQYRVTPKKSGRLRIPAVSVRFEGQEIKSLPVQINVVEPEPQEYVIVELSSNREKIYPTQTFSVNLRILVRALPDKDQDPLIPIRRNPPNISIPWIEDIDGLRSQEERGRWLQNLLSDQGYGFSINDISSRSGFLFDGPRVALFDLVRGKETRKLENGEEATFFRYEVTQSFAAIRPGTYTFGPATVRGTFVIDSEGREYRGKKIAASAKPLVLTVSEVPTPRPVSFFGGIGTFTASIDISPKEARVGDPMTLTLDVTGQTADALEQVYAPDLSQFELIAKDFEIMDRSPVGKLDRNRKFFTYGIRPKSKLDFFPEIEFSSFDPDTEEFRSLKTKPVPLKIDQGATLKVSDIAGVRTSQPLRVEQEQSGIFQGTREMYPYKNERVSVTVWTGIAGASWLVALGAATLLRMKRGRAKNTLQARLQIAKRTSLSGLQNAKIALTEGRTNDALALVRQALLGMVGAERGTDGQGFTTQDMMDTLNRTNLTPSECSAIEKILEGIDSARYGGVSNADAAAMVESAASSVTLLYDALSKPHSGESARESSLLLIAILFAAPTGPVKIESSEPSHPAAFEAAVSILENAKTSEEFLLAAKRLEELEKSGVTSGSLHFHCGNAWFQAGGFGNAIRHYRMATFYAPRDGYLHANLKQALAMAPGRLSEQPETNILSNILFWGGWLSYPMKIQFGSLLLSVSALLFLVYSWHGSKKFLVSSVIGAVISISLLVEGILHSPERYASSHGVLNTQVTVRKGMGEEYAPAFSQPLKDGAEFEVLFRTSDWTLGRFPGIGDGWVKNESIAGG